MEKKHEVEIMKRTTGTIIEITLSNGDLFRISVADKDNYIEVQTIDGAIAIRPSVSNEIFISGAEWMYRLMLPEIKRLNFELKELGYDLMRGREPKGWIPVSERLPEVGEYVLVNVGTDTVLKGRLYHNGWSAFFADGEHAVGTIREVSHWMPLPPPPGAAEPDQAPYIFGPERTKKGQ